MNALFCVETDRVVLTWGVARGKEPAVLAEATPPPGLLKLRMRRVGATFGGQTQRRGVPAAVAADPGQSAGPLLYEQTDYKVYLRAKTDAPVALMHRDPLIRRDLASEEHGRVIHGYINFGSEIGRSVFSVLVDGRPEFDFEVEVFPSKLDYVSDYEQLLADVQDVLTALALEYLRSTYRLGKPSPVPQPAHLEWLILLRHVADRLEQALQQVSERPIRGLTRDPVSTRVERIKHVDSAVRSAVRRGKGSGARVALGDGIVVRRRLQERRARSTLDTPEHRWLATQLDRIRRRIAWLRREEAARPDSERRRQAMREMDALETRITRLSRLEPLAVAEGNPPAGFASLQLLAAPGYREAYQACLILSLGLRLEDGPIHLSVKDLSLLYEYWCYLALVRLISEETGQPIPAGQLLAIRQQGLQVLLQKGRETSVDFPAHAGRKVRAIYNPGFHGASTLIPQRPDVLISFDDPEWPTLHLVLDAKYRVEASPEYKARYGSYGPPEDALNVLHRYRDAILEADGGDAHDARPKHAVVQAAAAFPLRDGVAGAFGQSKLWQSLDRLGVGAVPLLPGDTEYLREWLRSALRQGGWALADRVISHRAWERAREWRLAASEPVLVGLLRPGNEAEHLKWIQEEQLYYMPLLKTQRRQYAAKRVALYSPTALRQPPAVVYCGTVEAVDVVRRDEIPTPWPSRRDPAEWCVRYTLGEVTALSRPIVNAGDNGRGQRFSIHRWTSRLALERAKVVEELLLETEPEWRLYEDLVACGAAFHLEAARLTSVQAEDPTGHAWFALEDGAKARYTGAAGFLVRFANSREKYYARAEQAAEAMLQSSS